VKTIPAIDWRVNEREGDVAFRWGYAGEDVVAEWEGVLTLRASRSGELKEWRAVTGVSVETVEKTRRGVARAFLRAQREQHSLHASAVSCHGRAIVFLGGSGLGKSTMAELLCRRSGVEILADDTTAIELLPNGWHVLPSESLLWLAIEGATAKIPVSTAIAAGQPAVLQWFVSLEFDDDASTLALHRLRGADAVSALLPSVLRFERTAAIWARELDLLGDLVSTTRIVRATRSRGVSAVSVADALFELAMQERR
jgi:hypothetical protein